MVSMRVVRTLAGALAEGGVSQATFLRAARLEPGCLQDAEARVPRRKFTELVGLALELAEDPALGIHSMERVPGEAMNPIAGLVAHADSWGSAFRCIEEFRRLRGDSPTYRIHASGTQLLLRCDDFETEALHVRRFMAEATLTGLFRLMRASRADRYVDRVAFKYSAPHYRTEYTRVFATKACFGQDFTGMGFERELLSASPPHPEPELHQALRSVATRQLARQASQPPYSKRVLEALVWQPPPRNLTMTSVARRLGMSERSLRRGLSTEGKAYADLVKQALIYLAKNCLIEEKRSIDETAKELGFADNTSFHRAFKRWTGLTPLQYRRQHTAHSK